MNLIKCKNGHFYDSEKFLSCPHCSNEQAGIEAQNLLGQDQHDINTDIPQSSGYPGQVSAHGKTVGWLVCISGAVLGESFCIREGATVSRKTHAVITYEPEQNSCILYPQKSSQTICNDRVIKRKKTLKNRDVVVFGTCTFIFIAFCGTAFSWEDYTSR